MTKFATPEPISVSLDLPVGDIRLVASDRQDTVVEVGPGHDSRIAPDEQVKVEFASGHLLIRGPKGWRHSRRDAVAVTIELPAGSSLKADVGVGTTAAVGRLAEVQYRSGMGDIALDEVASLRLTVGSGDVTVGRVRGPAQVKSGSGQVEMGFVEGSATVKAANGDVGIGEAYQSVRVSAANGAIRVSEAHGDVVTRSSNGPIRLGVCAGVSVVAATARGAIDLAVHRGVTVWLDLVSGFGRVVNELDQRDRPPAGNGRAEVRARTGFGDITVRRLTPPLAESAAS